MSAKRIRIYSEAQKEAFKERARAKYAARKDVRERHIENVKSYRASNPCCRDGEYAKRRAVYESTISALDAGCDPESLAVNSIARRAIKAWHGKQLRKAKPCKDKFQIELERREKKRPSFAGIGVLELFEWGKKQAAKQRFAEKYKNDPEFRVYQVMKVAKYKAKNTDRVAKWAATPKNKIGLCVRNSLRRAIYGIKSGEEKGSTQSIVGCSMSELKEWIECLFQPCMSWDNYGKVWSIDHIIPIRMAQGDLGVAKSLNHFTNLAPVTCQVNSTKSGSMQWDKHYRKKQNV